LRAPHRTHPGSAALGDQKNRMKISTARLKQIIKEELFYREFHRGTEDLHEERDMMAQPDFKSKVAWVKKNKPDIEDPDAYVASILRDKGEIKEEE